MHHARPPVVRRALVISAAVRHHGVGQRAAPERTGPARLHDHSTRLVHHEDVPIFKNDFQRPRRLGEEDAHRVVVLAAAPRPVQRAVDPGHRGHADVGLAVALLVDADVVAVAGG